MRCPATIFVTAAVAASLVLAPDAGASPECTRTGPTTTQCETPGHTQITTSPRQTNRNQWWQYGGYAIGFPW